jgi:hypothetical protein
MTKCTSCDAGYLRCCLVSAFGLPLATDIAKAAARGRSNKVEPVCLRCEAGLRAAEKIIAHRIRYVRNPAIARILAASAGQASTAAAGTAPSSASRHTAAADSGTKGKPKLMSKHAAAKAVAAEVAAAAASKAAASASASAGPADAIGRTDGSVVIVSAGLSTAAAVSKAAAVQQMPDCTWIPRLEYLVKWAGKGHWHDAWESGVRLEHVSGHLLRFYRLAQDMGSADEHLSAAAFGAPPPRSKV